MQVGWKKRKNVIDKHQSTNPNFGSQTGASLLEFLMAISVLAGTSVYVMKSISRSEENKLLSRSSRFIYSKDQLARFEISKLLERFQKRITELPPAKQCKKPYQDLVNVVQSNFALDPALYFGPLPDIKSEAGFDDKITASFTLLKRELSDGKFYLASQLQEAQTRCEQDQTIFRNKADIAKRTSIYLCGYSKKMLVEVKASFWDFNTGLALRCDDMNERPGRGIQAIYTIYHFRPLRTRSGARKRLGYRRYSISKFKGRLYVSKNVH